MQTTQVTPSAVRYNPMTNCFEAVVVIEAVTGTYRYPCSFEGSLKMPLTTAAHKLTQQAKRQHMNKSGLHARCDAAPAMGAPVGPEQQKTAHLS